MSTVPPAFPRELAAKTAEIGVHAIDACVLTVPTPKPMALEFPHHKLVVAEIATDEGIRGLGYSLSFGGGGAESVLVYLETRLKPLLQICQPRVSRLPNRDCHR